MLYVVAIVPPSAHGDVTTVDGPPGLVVAAATAARPIAWLTVPLTVAVVAVLRTDAVFVELGDAGEFPPQFAAAAASTTVTAITDHPTSEGVRQLRAMSGAGNFSPYGALTTY